MERAAARDRFRRRRHPEHPPQPAPAQGQRRPRGLLGTVHQRGAHEGDGQPDPDTRDGRQQDDRPANRSSLHPRRRRRGPPDGCRAGGGRTGGGQALTDFVVIGGGMAGVSAAAHLAPHGRVTIIEAESSLAYHTTGRSAALFVVNYGGHGTRPLAAASAGFFVDPPEGATDAPLLTHRGLLWI